MANILGFHAERLTDDVVALIRRAHPGVVVTMDLDAGRLAAIRPYTRLLIGRYDPGGDTQNGHIGDGTGLGHFILAGVSPVAHLLDAVTVLNEPETWTEAEAVGNSKVAVAAARVALTLVDACTVLSGAGIKTVVGNFSTGTPHLPGDDGGLVLDALLPGIAAGDYYGGHEYSYPSMRAGYGYLLGRTTRILDYYAGKGLHKQAILTEYGIDFGLVAPRPSGYAANDVTDDAYLADLRWAHAALSVEPRILGAAVFEVGSYGRFASFDLLGTGLGQRYAAFLATQAGSAPQRAQDAPQGTGTAQTAPAPVVTSHAPVLKIGHAMPAPIFAYDQGWTKDCWLRCTEAFFLRYGYAVSVDQIFQAAKGRPYPAGGEAATFAEVERGIRALAVQLGVKIQLAEFNDPPTVWNALHDADTANPWTIIIGVQESVLQGSSQQYGHFMVLDKDLGGGNVHVVDSYGNEDGDATGVYPWSLVAQAMVASWEPAVDAIGCKIIGSLP